MLGLQLPRLRRGPLGAREPPCLDHIETPRDAGLEVLLCGTMSGAEWAAWRPCLAAAAPAVRWLDVDAARARPQSVRAAVVANPPAGSLAGWPGLELIQSLWAGVDRLLADPTVPPGVPLARMVDPAMTQAMAETALWAVLALHRGFFTYAHQQSLGQWQQHEQERPREVPVLVLGAGQLGSAVGEVLRPLGYPVSCWRRSDGPAALGPLLRASRIVVNLLPLTPQTRGLVDERFLAAMPRGAGLVNLADMARDAGQGLPARAAGGSRAAAARRHALGGGGRGAGRLLVGAGLHHGVPGQVRADAGGVSAQPAVSGGRAALRNRAWSRGGSCGAR